MIRGAIWSILAQYGGGGSGSSGGGGYSTGYWIVVGVVALVVIGVAAWILSRMRARRGSGSVSRSEPERRDEAA
jgi:hypothetical protein